MIESLWHTLNTSEIRTSPIPNGAFLDPLVESKYSMISLGTEAKVLHQLVPKRIEDYMKVPYMEGDFDLPIKYGYALSGVLDSGEKVHIMHPHQNKCIVNKQSIFKDCQELPLKRIPLISNMETIINAIWDCQIEGDMDVVVSGFGNIGSLLAVTLKYVYNRSVKVIEPNSWRRDKALELGFETYDNQSGFDVIFNTAANEAALQFCIDNANEEGQIVDLSWHGTLKTTLTLGETFHKNRLRLIASQVSKIPKSKRGEYDFYKRKLLAVKILRNDIFDRLITNIIPFNESPVFFNSLRNNDIPNGLIYMIKY